MAKNNHLGKPTNLTIQFPSETAARRFWELVFEWDGFPYPRGELRVPDFDVENKFETFKVMLVDRHMPGRDCDTAGRSDADMPENAWHLNPSWHRPPEQ